MFKINFFRKSKKTGSKDIIRVNKSDVHNLLTFHAPTHSDMYGDYYHINGRIIYATAGMKTTDLVKECDTAAKHTLKSGVSRAELQKEAIEKHIRYFLANV